MQHILLVIFTSILLSACSVKSTQEISFQSDTSHSALEATIDKKSDKDIGVQNPFENYPISLANLIKEPITATALKLGSKEYTTASYARYQAKYAVNGVLNSAIINIPFSATAENPAPVVVTNHGYIDPKIYTSGRGLKREQNYFANNGFVVIHPDYRNHAYSDKNLDTTSNFRFGYVQDSIGAILSLKELNDPRIDTNNVFMLGHSMGGGVTMKAILARPELIKAAVLYASVSSNERDNFDKWTRNSYPQASQILESYGDFLENPEFWDSISIDSYFETFQTPVLIQQGVKDKSTPIEWGRNTYAKLIDAKKDVQMIEYPFEGHEFATSFNSFMNSSLDFFKNYIE